MHPIHLKCGIESCNDGYDYKLDLKHPIALCGEFRDIKLESKIWKGLLPTTPTIGKKYRLTLNNPVKMDISEPFWVLYLNPSSTLDGFENETGIESFTFCLCKQTKIIDLQRRSILMQVEMMDTKGIKDLLHYPPNPNNDLQVLDSYAISKSSYQVYNLNHFSLLAINVQSDLGWTYIVLKEENRSVIVAENIWGFHENFWRIINKELTKEEGLKYGVE